MFNTRRSFALALVTAAGLVPATAAQAGHNPPITPAGHAEVKWILPPSVGSEFYNYDTWFAGVMGYETVETDDVTYPPPRP